MNEAAKVELEHRVALYQFYIGSYLKAIAFYLAISAALFKFAFDEPTQRSVFATAGLVWTLGVLIPLVYGIRHRIGLAADFVRLARATKTTAISTAPFLMAIWACSIFWLVMLLSWLYILYWMPVPSA